MRLTYRGSVNNWECDENAHLNVRYHVDKLWQTARGYLGQVSTDNVSVEHIRFAAEARMAEPLSGYCGVIGSDSVLCELRKSFSGEPISSCIYTLKQNDLVITDEVSDHAAPRGVVSTDTAYALCDQDQLEALGFALIGRGTVSANECESPDGLQLHHYMGRLSDSMPHLWGRVFAALEDARTNEGGAVLEYRLSHHTTLRTGDTFSIHSGIAEVGRKVQRFIHLMFNERTHRLVVSAEAVGVRMDLIDRRAVTFSDEMMETLNSLVLRTPN